MNFIFPTAPDVFNKYGKQNRLTKWLMKAVRLLISLVNRFYLLILLTALRAVEKMKHPK